jgi:hypothetical protein
MAARRQDQGRQHACPTRPGRRCLGLSRSRHRQAPCATAPRKTAHSAPGQPLESPGPAVATLPTPRGARQTRPRGHGGSGPCTGGLHVGHCHRGAGNTGRLPEQAEAPDNSAGAQRALAAAQPRGGGTLGSVTRLVEDTRAETAAGTRRRHARWSPPHGSPQDHPSHMAGSASANAPRTPTR